MNKGQSLLEVAIFLLVVGGLTIGFVLWRETGKQTETQKAATINNYTINLPKIGFWSSVRLYIPKGTNDNIKVFTNACR